ACRGSSPVRDYRHSARDRALARRFQRIDVHEPSVADTVRILQGLAPRYEQHHGVRYTAGALRAAAELSAKHLNDHFLPDKAIDVIDEAGAAVKLRPRRPSPPREGERLAYPARGAESAARSEAESAEPSEAHQGGAESAARSEAESAEPSEAHQGGAESAARSEAESAEPSEAHQGGAEGAARSEATPSPPRQGDRLEYPASGAEGAARSEAKPSEVNRRAAAPQFTVGVRDVETVIARMARIPLARAAASERARLENLEGDLKKVVFAQDEAVATVSRPVRP